MLKTLPADTLAWPRRAAIIGAGTMGLGVAESWIAAGVAVTLVDVAPEQTRLAHERLAQRVQKHAEAGLVDPAVSGRVASMPMADDIASAVNDADLVFEAVFERIEVKRTVLGAIEAAVRPTTLIASNTSSLPIDDLAALLGHPQRFLGMHWFNPPEWTPGIELIPAQSTNPLAVEQARSFLQAIGKRPIVVRERPGLCGQPHPDGTLPRSDCVCRRWPGVTGGSRRGGAQLLWLSAAVLRAASNRGYGRAGCLP